MIKQSPYSAEVLPRRGMMNILASGYSKIGGRKHLEEFTVAKREWGDSFFAVFDGHCGAGAARYAHDNLWDNIKTTEGFYSDDPQTIKKAIIGGFAKTQDKMLKLGVQNLGISGTTVACVVLRKGLMFVAGVGDSAVILGKLDPIKGPIAKVVTVYHKPDNEEEEARIVKMGGTVELINGVKRVVYEPEFPSQATDDESRPHYAIPKLNLSRGLGDLWSFMASKRDYLISPVPDVFIYHLDPTVHKYIVIATDGVLDVLSPQKCVQLVHDVYKDNVDVDKHKAIEATQKLLNVALNEWQKTRFTADNLSAVTILFTSTEFDYDYIEFP